ncbi:MAG: DedA family protein [Magnetococcales bacterium]|nr:DedA family protein [Magnetococcales bacterium]MBF0157621.1 DedA family protein [Magnetococcales bacterium]
MDTLETFLIDYGYLVLFLGTFFEGETILLVAAYLSTPAMGYLDLWTSIIVAGTGTFLGDQAVFWFGRRWGKEFLAKRASPRWQERTSRVMGLIAKWDIWFILSYRFFYGIRNVSSLTMGLTPIPSWRFLILNALASALWAITFGLAGYYIGDAFRAFLSRAQKYEITVLVVIVAVALAIYLVNRYRGRNRAEPSSRS